MKILRVFLLCVLTMSFASCGDDVYYMVENSNNDLCNKLWVANYTEDGTLYSYRLQFLSTGKGWEILSSPSPDGGTDTHTQEITWSWTDDSKECLKWTSYGTVTYLDNVWVRQHYLSGEIDGKQLVFVEDTYQH